MSFGKAREGFDIDLRNGQAREDAFVHVFLQAKVEHKRDYVCQKTGNIFIEYRQKGRPSGIATSTADYWAIEYMHRRWIIVPTDELREIARRAAKDKRNRVCGGDGDQYEGVAVRLTSLLPQWGVVR